MKWIHGLLLTALCTLLGHADASEPVTTHQLTLRILVDGQEVMTPTLRMLPGRTAYLTSKRPGLPAADLGLEVDMEPKLTVQGETGTGLRFTLWEGPAGKGERLHDTVMLLTPEKRSIAARSGLSPSTTMRAPSGRMTEIQVISHAVTTEDASVVARMVDCPNAGKDGGGDPITIDRESHCCSSGCANGEDRQFTCCGAISCCDCDACCHAL